MFGQALEVSGLKVSLSVAGSMDVLMSQVSPVTVTCVMDGSTITSVHADEGIEFASDGGLLELSYMRCADITELCDRRAMEKELRLRAEENDAMQVHAKGEF